MGTSMAGNSGDVWAVSMADRIFSHFHAITRAVYGSLPLEQVRVVGHILHCCPSSQH